MHCLRQPQRSLAQHSLELHRQAAHASKNCHTPEQLRGIEGAAQRALFDYWRQTLPAEWGFHKRQRRPPSDPINALLSLTFQLTYHEAIRQALATGLDPWLGFYHQLAPSRMSLACDLMEPLRPNIEAWVVDAVLQGELDRRHFSHSEGACLLGKSGRELYYGLWHAQLPTWRRKLRRYARLYARFLDATTHPQEPLI